MTPTPEDEERAAMAIWDLRYPLYAWDKATIPVQDPFREMARAALSSLVTDREPGSVEVRELLTEEEHELVTLLGQCWVRFSKICGSGRSRARDCAEFVTWIHACQHAVLSQAAGRAYPDTYRLLGESFDAPIGGQ